MNGHSRKRESASKGIRWQALVFVDAGHGGPRTEAHGTFARKTDADARWQDVVESYRRGTYRRPSLVSVRAYGDRWLREDVGMGKAGNTYRFHASNLAHHIYPTFGERVAGQVSAAEVSTWQADQLDHGRRDEKGVAMKSLVGYRGTLHALYAWLVGLGELAANPVASCPAPRHRPLHPDPPSVEEMRRFVTVLEEAPRLRLPTFLLAASGLRRGEVLALRWSDIDLHRTYEDETGCWRYAASLCVHPDRGNLTGSTRADLHFGPAKTKKGARAIPLPEYAAAELYAQRSRQVAEYAVAGIAYSPAMLVCCREDGAPTVPDYYTHRLARFCKRHSLPPIHPHLLRHAVATAMLEAGVSLEAVSAHLGHSTIVTTADTYGHVRKRVLSDAAARYGEQWERAGAGSDAEAASESRGHSGDKTPAGDELAVRRRRKQA